MSTETVQRSIEHEIEGEPADDEMLATLEEREQNRWQMEELERRTVAPDLMKLKVATVTSAENSEQWAIDIAHPVLDDIRVFAEKPLSGWSNEYKIVRILDWYTPGNRDPHQLEFEEVYVEKNPEESEYAHGWQLVRPPGTVGRIERSANELRETIGEYRIDAKNQYIWAGLGAGPVLGAIASTFVAVSPVLTSIVGYVLSTLMVLVLMDLEVVGDG